VGIAISKASLDTIDGGRTAAALFMNDILTLLMGGLWW
jgi:hypothetical protein